MTMSASDQDLFAAARERYLRLLPVESATLAALLEVIIKKLDNIEDATLRSASDVEDILAHLMPPIR